MEEQRVRPPSRLSPSSPEQRFITYPVELVALERRQAVTPTRLGLLMLRRFADPDTGLWETTTQNVASLLHIGRSTAQKVLRALERDRYVHLRDLRGRTVRRQVMFGGFPQPFHRKLGLPPLRWDGDFTAPDAEAPQPYGLSTPVENSAEAVDSGSDKPKTEGSDTPGRTVPDTYVTNHEPTNHDRNEPREESFLNSVPTNHEPNEPGAEHTPTDRDVVEKSARRAPLTLVEAFQPRRYEHFVVKDLARKLGERYINSFLALQRRHGLPRLRRACDLAQQKLFDRTHPLRQTPGAYVRWLLQNDRC